MLSIDSDVTEDYLSSLLIPSIVIPSSIQEMIFNFILKITLGIASIPNHTKGTYTAKDKIPKELFNFEYFSSLQAIEN